MGLRRTLTMVNRQCKGSSPGPGGPQPCPHTKPRHSLLSCTCLLYTSDAADERSSVDLGGRRIIKKKKKKNFFFFFKQKTAYEMLRSLVGSEMCIRDRPQPCPHTKPRHSLLSC